MNYEKLVKLRKSMLLASNVDFALAVITMIVILVTRDPNLVTNGLIFLSIAQVSRWFADFIEALIDE